MMKGETLDADKALCSLKDHNSYNSLRQRAWERCEFCEEIFSTRLDNIKHNASHIIIPLLKLSLLQCDECLFHFTSLNDLRTHATTKNHTTSQLTTSHKPGYEDLLQRIVEKQLVVKCHDTLKISHNNDVIKSLSPIKSVEEEIPIEISSDLERSSPTILKNGTCNGFEDISNIQRELSSPIESARSRIMFEDDDDDLFEPEEILPDKYPPKNTYIIGSISNKLNGSNEIKCVSYDDLIAPELCDCRYCGRCFSNRLELIKHETTHMQVSRTLPTLCYVCEKYLSGNHWTLRRHLKKHHPTQERKLAIHKCTYCHLNYHNYQRHVSLYHFVTCKVCNRRMDRQKLKLHNCFQNEPDITETVVKMCEMCLTFTKNKQNIHYEVIGEHSEVGTRQQCEKCLAKYFEVKLVKRRSKARIECDTEKKRKPLSNQERLKKMQNRLKMVKRMNKC